MEKKQIKLFAVIVYAFMILSVSLMMPAKVKAAPESISGIEFVTEKAHLLFTHEDGRDWKYAAVVTSPDGKDTLVKEVSYTGTTSYNMKPYAVYLLNYLKDKPSGTYTVIVYAINKGEEFTETDNGQGGIAISNAVGASEPYTFSWTAPTKRMMAPTNYVWVKRGNYIVLRWSFVPNAKHYDMEIRKGGSMSFATVNEGSEYIFYGIEPGYTYKTRMKTYSPDYSQYLDSNWSEFTPELVIDQNGNATVNGEPLPDDADVTVDNISIVNGFYYVNGVIDTSKKGFVNYDGSKFLIASGRVVTSANGMVQDPEHRDIWYYCANGQVATKKTGLVQYNGSWFYVENGRLDTTYNGLVDYDNSKFLVARGRIVTSKNGLGQDPNNTSRWYFFANGQAQLKKQGPVSYGGTVFFVSYGLVDMSPYSHWVTCNGTSYRVMNGQVLESKPA